MPKCFTCPFRETIRSGARTYYRCAKLDELIHSEEHCLVNCPLKDKKRNEQEH